MRKLLLTATAALICTSLSACNNAATQEKGATGAAAASASSGPALDPLLADPKVGDLYASKLSAFSAMEFNEGRPERTGKDSFGLLKVVEVNADRVTVITEKSAWDEPDGALADLRGDLADIEWDPEERIPVNRADFAQLMADGKLLETRRLTGAAAAAAH
ncbi:MAG: hypothetical protein ACKOUM_12900 [Sphingopyxis sp.]